MLRNVKSIREEKKISQKNLASLAKLTPHALNRMEARGTNFKISTLVAIAEALEVGLEDLFGFEGTSSSEKVKYCIDILNEHAKR